MKVNGHQLHVSVAYSLWKRRWVGPRDCLDRSGHCDANKNNFPPPPTRSLVHIPGKLFETLRVILWEGFLIRPKYFGSIREFAKDKFLHVVYGASLCQLTIKLSEYMPNSQYETYLYTFMQTLILHLEMCLEFSSTGLWLTSSLWAHEF